MTTTRQPHPVSDPESEIAAVTIGGGILLTQAFALFPGLFPCLLLLLPFVLPLIVLAPLVAIPYGLWKLGSSVLRRLAPAGRAYAAQSPGPAVR
ncbi:MAG TPA: hypothetical protein VN606_07025 [Thermoleophilaceae bacterium]|jgi:hypothetical protein|nr:hypothetical protein [Thermoleophilaceae bacterium]